MQGFPAQGRNGVGAVVDCDTSVLDLDRFNHSIRRDGILQAGDIVLRCWRNSCALEGVRDQCLYGCDSEQSVADS